MLHHNIRDFRVKMGLTQEQVAKALDLAGKSSVSGWELGASAPRTELLPRLAKLFGCTIDDLFRGPVEEAPSPEAA